MKTLSFKAPQLAALAIALSCGFATSTMAMTSAEHKAQEKRIEADYKTNKDKCQSLSGNAKDIYASEAKGMEKIAKADMASQYKPSPKADAKLRETRADAVYDTAKEKCDDLAGNAKDVCVKDAKAAHVAALGEAKVRQTSATTSGDKTSKVAEVRKDVTADTRQAEYDAAKERCDALAGNAKDTCVADAQAKYGM